MGLGRPPSTRNRHDGSVTVGTRPPQARIDPGPPQPGINAHIVIDNVGYIFASLPTYTQESQKGVTQENLAPYFGDPQNALDQLSSDLTMLLPIGQNDFSTGIGSTDLERLPKGYERGENLMWTPQNTLINGPKIKFEAFTSNPNPLDSRGYQEGYFGGTIDTDSTAYTYFGIGGYLYARNAGSAVWSPLPCRYPITDILGYSGRIVVGYGDSQGDVFYHNTAYPATYKIHKSLILNSNPFIMYRDGRVYSAFLFAPEIVSIADETGAATTLTHWAYAIQYVITLPDATKVATGLGPLHFATKLPNMELVLGIPTKGYKGGPVLRRLYRTATNDLNTFYMMEDETALGSNLVRYVDIMTDATLITKPQYSFTTVNDTGIVILLAGEVNRNMQFPDSNPIWLAEKLVAPYAGDYVTCVKTFHDAQGNEGAMIGTTSGLFLWDGLSVDFQTLRLSYFHPLNFRYMAVNHGFVYYTMMGHMLYQWTPEKQTVVNGPWATQFTSIDEIRISNNSNYLTVAVAGVNKYYPGTNTCTLYLYDGEKFVWSSSWSAADIRSVTSILGSIANENSLAFYKGYLSGGINKISLDPLYSEYQTDNVLFRSASSDADLPRLRKQVHAVMVRYLKLSPQANTFLSEIAAVGINYITVASTAGFAVGDWLRIQGVGGSLIQSEYRKITSIAGNVIGFTHVLGNNLIYAHPFGSTVRKCGAVTKLRNVFTDALSTQDIEIGGPCDPGELFAYVRLPQPVYTYADGIELAWTSGTVMELIGWAMLTGLNPMWNGLSDINIRLQDYVKLPNNLYDDALASERADNLKTAYNKGTVEVIDPLGTKRLMRFQRLNFTYEEPKERHADGEHMQATASVRMIDQLAELNKQGELVVNVRQQ